MRIIRALRNLYIDAVFWFLCLTSSFISLALAETNTGRFLMIPLMTVSAFTSSALALMHCCKGIEDENEDDRGKYTLVSTSDKV